MLPKVGSMVSSHVCNDCWACDFGTFVMCTYARPDIWGSSLGKNVAINVHLSYSECYQETFRVAMHWSVPLICARLACGYSLLAPAHPAAGCCDLGCQKTRYGCSMPWFPPLPCGPVPAWHTQARKRVCRSTAQQVCYMTLSAWSVMFEHAC